jgi:energy-coupling factor transporter ATP-binding protein EcfA2
VLNLYVRNWCCWAHQAFELGPCSFVVGRNGSGKTSLRDALEFVLIGTGQLRGYRTKQELAAWAIRDDLSNCEVIFQTDVLRLRRTMDRDGTQELFRSVWIPTHGRADDQAAWTDEEKLSLKRDQGNPFGSAPDDLVRCMLEPTHFYRLDSQRRQEVLVQATSDPDLEEGVVLAALMRRLEYQDADDLTALESAAAWVHEDGFRTAEDAAIEQRQQAKRDLGDLVVGEPPERNWERTLGLREDLMTQPVAAVQASLKTFREDHLVAVKMQSAGAGALQGKLLEAENAYKRLQETELAPVASLARLAVAGSELAAIEGLDQPADPGEWDEQALENATTRSTLAGEASNLAATSAREATGAIAVLEAKLETPAAFPRPAECPKGPPGMRCPVKPSVWAPALTRALGDRTKLEAELDRLRGDLVELRTAEADTHEEARARDQIVVELGRQWRVRQTSIQKIDDKAAAIRRASGRVTLAEEAATADEQAQRATHEADLEKRRMRVELAQVALDAARAGDQPTGATVAELAEAIEYQEHLLEAARDFWREQHGWEERTDMAAAIERTVARWDRICQELKPDGVETELAGGAREAFLVLLSGTHGLGLSGEIHLDEDCGITVLLDDDVEDQPRHLLQLSTSQRLAVAVAIQHALCQLEGFPLLLVDCVDTFRGDKLKAFQAFAESVVELYPAAVIGLATLSREPPGAAAGPWTTLWLKPDHQVVTIGGEF